MTPARLQPYHLQPDPRGHPLWHLHRFSNADKHRQLSTYWPVPMDGRCSVSLNTDGVCVESHLTPPSEWEPDTEKEIIRYRFARPYPTYMKAEANLDLMVHFGTAAFGNELEHVIEAGVVSEIRHQVSTAIELFEEL